MAKLYDRNGNIIGDFDPNTMGYEPPSATPTQSAPTQSASPQSNDFLGGLIQGITDPFSRLIRGGATAGMRALGVNKDYLTQKETEEYKNPLNIAKDVASAGSWFLPVGPVKGLGSLLKVGAKQGALSGFGGSYGQNLEDTIASTLTGGVTGAGTSGVLGLAGKALSKKPLLGIEKSASKIETDPFKKAEKSFSLTGRDKQKQFFQDLQSAELAPAKKTDNAIKSIRQSKNVLDSLELPPSLDGIMEGKDRIAKKMDEYMLEKSNSLVSQRYKSSEVLNKKFVDKLNNLTDKNRNITPQMLIQTASDFLGQKMYGKQKGMFTRELTAKDMAKAIQDINIATRQGKLTGTQKKVAELVKQSIYDAISKDAPEYKKLARKYATLASAEEATAEVALKGQRTASTDPIKEMQASVYKQAKKAIGKAGEKVVDVLPDKISLTKGDFTLGKGGQLKQNLAQRALMSGLTQQVPTEDTGLSELQSKIEMPMPKQPTQTGDKEQFDAIMNQFIADGMKPSDARRETIALTGYDPAKAEVKVSQLAPAQKTAMSGAKAALQDIDILINRFEKQGSMLPFAGGIAEANPFDVQGQAFKTRLGALNKNLATAMEKKSPTDADMKYYLQFLPKMTDAKNVGIARLLEIKKMLQSQIQAIESQQ